MVTLDKEPVPNIRHWQQEFVVIGGRVIIRNKTSEMDDSRYPMINRIPDQDELFSLGEDMVLPLGRGTKCCHSDAQDRETRLPGGC